MRSCGSWGWDLPDEFACFPVILLDEVAVIWASKGGHDVLAYYKGASAYMGVWDYAPWANFPRETRRGGGDSRLGNPGRT